MKQILKATFANHLLGTSCELENDVDYSIDSEIKMDLTEENIPSENPWSVPNVSEFLKYCCPECDYSDHNLDDFSEHAIENHLLSITLFDLPKNRKTSKIISEETVTTNGNTVTDIKIEPVIDMYDNNEDDIKSENKGAFCQEFVWSKSFLGNWPVCSDLFLKNHISNQQIAKNFDI